VQGDHLRIALLANLRQINAVIQEAANQTAEKYSVSQFFYLTIARSRFTEDNLHPTHCVLHIRQLVVGHAALVQVYTSLNTKAQPKQAANEDSTQKCSICPAGARAIHAK
jgi:hypothetical protein